MDHFEKKAPIIEGLKGWDRIEELMHLPKYQRVFGACAGYLKGYTAGQQLLYLKKEEIDQ